MPTAVVIGAGHNGLVAANLLADRGWSVCVVEAGSHPGGAVHSDESIEVGWVTDWFSAFYPLAAASPVLTGLNLQRWGLRWSHAPAVLAHVLPDGRAAVIERETARTAASLDRFAPGDGAAWAELVTEYRRIEGPLLRALLEPFPPVRSGIGLLRRMGVADGMRFARFAVQPVRRFGEERFRGLGGPILLAGNALHTDLPPEAAGSAIYGWLLCMLAQTVGFPVPVGGSGAIISALIERLRSRGGTLRLRAPVAAIQVAHGRASGVVLGNGEVLPADAVVADVSAPHLFCDLLDPAVLPDRMVADLRDFQWDAPTLKVNWTLDRPIPWTAADARRAGTVHLGVDLNGLTDYAGALAKRTFPSEPFLLLGQMTTSDPTRSPAGTESAWAYTHLPELSDFASADIARQVERVEAAIEQQAPGFLAGVRRRVVQGPADLQQADANLHHGAVSGGTSALHQQLFFRPTPGLARADTPIDQLFLASASAHPGGGVHGAPGANAARAAIRRNGPGGAVYRSAVSASFNRLYR